MIAHAAIATVVLLAALYAWAYVAVIRPQFRQVEAEWPICEDCRHARCLEVRADRQMRWSNAGDERGIYGNDVAAALMRDVEG